MKFNLKVVTLCHSLYFFSKMVQNGLNNSPIFGIISYKIIIVALLLKKIRYLKEFVQITRIKYKGVKKMCGMVGEIMSNPDLINLLEKAMNGSTFRHSVLANNIANVNTPGYKRADVNFRSCFDEALDNQLGLETTSPLHLKRINQKNSPEIVIDTQTTLRNDGNNVDIDIELATMSENNLYFNSLAQLLSSQLSMLRQAIAEGRR